MPAGAANTRSFSSFNSTMHTTIRTVLRQAGVIIAVALLPLIGKAADLDVRTASIGLADGAWQLMARIDYRLTEEARKAIENGVVLTFRVEVEVARLRQWLPNEDIASVAEEWQLSYEPLSERYVVRYPRGTESSSHATLFGALNALGRVQGLRVAAEAELERGSEYEIAVRAQLSEQQLPAPLWAFRFWDSGFSLSSDWYEWTFVP